MEKTKYTIRHIVRVVVEAKTPLAIASGDKNLLTDSVVMADINGLPMIPASSIAGVLRNACGWKCDEDCILGFQKSTGAGSQVLFSDAAMVGKDGKAVDGIQSIDYTDEFYSHFRALPIRQHVRINDKGTADNGGKFDGQVTYKGCRFCFEMEYLSSRDSDKDNQFALLINQLGKDTLRIGGGTRNGFGELAVASMKEACYDLETQEGLEHYLNHSTALNKEDDHMVEKTLERSTDEAWQSYTLRLKPTDFFLFGSGMGDDEADMTPVSEACIDWEDNKPKFAEACVLIPATSVKGAIAHRTAYHWNKLCGRFADTQDGNHKALTEDKNPAVEAIFGKAGANTESIKRGNILLSDVLIAKKKQDKIINHVAIERFTGGSIDGALFTEKVTNGKEMELVLHAKVLRSSIADETIRQAFERTLQDIANGLLPLGGGVNRGNGMFEGSLTIEESTR